MAVQRAHRTLVALLLLIVALPALPIAAQSDDEETWEAKFFPVTVTYTKGLWGNRTTSSFEGNERFQVVARATSFTMQLFTRDDLTNSDCLDGYLESIEAIDRVSNLIEFEDGEYPAGLPGAADVLVSYDFLWSGRETPVPMIQYVMCQEIEPGSMLLIGIETRAGIYEEEIEIIDGILAGVEINR